MEYNKKLYMNGINGVTGQYLVDPMDYHLAADWTKGVPHDTDILDDLPRVMAAKYTPHFGLPYGLHPEKVEEAGWGIVFHTEEQADIKESLEPLVAHRQQQIGDANKVKILDYQSDEGWSQWLTRHKVQAGSVIPSRVPFYLLLVGSPEQIPFWFGHLLSIEYAVGRLHLATSKEYRQYVASLVDYENKKVAPTGRQAVFFAPRHAYDPATQLSADSLVNPLVDGVPAEDGQPAQLGICVQSGFAAHKIWAEEATKAALIETLIPARGKKSPSLLFTASHGVGWPRGHQNQRTAQGALLCQDWKGFGTMRPTDYFAASDIPSEARVHGMITFHFACYSAGTPAYDRYFREPGNPPQAIAEEAFVASLPKAFLSHGQGGALACIGHVDRAWGYSIGTSETGRHLIPFQNAIAEILAGQPVGYAMKDFAASYAALSNNLTNLLERLDQGFVNISDEELVDTWIERNNAEGYVILGDPAVRLHIDVIQ